MSDSGITQRNLFKLGAAAEDASRPTFWRSRTESQVPEQVMPDVPVDAEIDPCGRVWPRRNPTPLVVFNFPASQ